MPDITLHDIDESTYSAIRAAVETEDFSLIESQPRPPKRTLGTWKGLVRIAPDFDDLPQDIAEAFGMEGGETA